MLELSWNGTKEIVLKNGEKRLFIEDGDVVIIKANCEKDGKFIGFGDCVCPVLPAKIPE